jgi:CelD/BcsL family acetyltransferase involved in cellulose biosynthesis
MTAVLQREPLAVEELTLQDGRWLDFVARSPDALPFHHPAWAEFIAECYRFRPPFALAVTDETQRIVAGLPIVEVRSPLGARRWISLPFTDALPPLGENEAGRARLVRELQARRERDGLRSVEVRSELASAGAYPLSEALIHVLALQRDPDAVFATFHRSQVQRGIRKGQREGTIVRRAADAADLTHVFYDLHTETRRRHGVPVQPRRFFELLWRRVLEPGLGFLLIAEVHGRPVAAAVFLAWNGTVAFKYGASSRDFSTYRPTHLVMWSAIQWACENDYRAFDFGRTDLGNDGLRSFKRGWGTDERVLAYSVIGRRPPSPSNERSIKLLRIVIRRSPPFVSRLLGGLLYRYAA